MVLDNGKWTGPTTASGAPSSDLVDALLESRAGTSTPQYLRVTSAAPSGANTPIKGSAELAALQRLTSAGIRLGVAIGTAPNAKALPASDVVAHAEQVRAASEDLGGLYDWIFLNQAVEHTPAGKDDLNDLQSIVDRVAAAGWSRIMINASGFTSKTFQYLPERTWAMARHFGLISPKSTADVGPVVAARTGAVVPGDLMFTGYVNAHRAGSTPVLKLEVSSQSSQFAGLPVADQTELLDLWAEGQLKDRYRIIYPLYIPGSRTGDGGAKRYDSTQVGTFWEQRTLMHQYG